MRRFLRIVLAVDYHFAAGLLLVAGVLKLNTAGVSELLQRLWEMKILSLPAMMAISRHLPWAEILLALVALSGWRAEWLARLLGTSYLIFIAAILIAAEGYLTVPLDCGCFGASEGTPVYLLVFRNLLIGVPLLFADASLRNLTIAGLFPFPSSSGTGRGQE